MNLYGLTRTELENYFENIGEKKFKALQVFEWLYQKRCENIEEFSNIKKEIREKLQNDLKKAIKEEKYEEAAKIRDEIKKLEEKK